eukprot:81432_1
MTVEDNLTCDHCKKKTAKFSYRCHDCYHYSCGACLVKNKKYKTIYTYCSKYPFSQGACRYAYKGTQLNPDQSQTDVVMKKFIDHTSYNADDWKGDLKCYKKAMEFIKEWNKLNLINKQYVMYEPTIIAGESPWSKWGQSLDDDDIKRGEYIMVETELKGMYEKWNSNSGWFSDYSMSVHAFCHWTY